MKSLKLISANSEYLESPWFFTDPAQTMTMAAWCRMPETNAHHVPIFIGDGDGTAIDAWYLNFGSAGTFAAATGQAGSVSFSTAPGNYVANTWQHGCGVYKGNNNRIGYLNGNAGTAETTARNVVAQRTWIGHYQDSSTHLYFNGEVCEIAVWNTNLSAGEVWGLAHYGLPAYLVRPNNLVAYYLPVGLFPETGSGALINYAPAAPGNYSAKPMTATSLRMGPYVPFTGYVQKPVMMKPNAFPISGVGGNYGYIL